MPAEHVNPYVGPRSFQINEPLFGRERELRLLTDRLLAERIVLLHSPSGAGKTSLVQAGLIPALRGEGFHVHPVVRVNLERPLELLGKTDTLTDAKRFNRYTFSTLLSLEEAYPPEKRIELPRLARMTLENYLEFRAREEMLDGPDFIIFDQFEEILTIDPMERAGKQAFFGQLGQALKDRNRWALFAMREDYLGALEPYSRSVPTYFANNFRLDLLGVNAALAAIQKPASAAGMLFTDEAASKLVDDLRRVQVQLPDGSMEATLGLFVEPVQLQVVCFRLWETLDFNDNDINLEDIAAVGDVDQSLAEYYAISVSKAAQETRVSERTIRDWFENRLITPEGIREQVLMGAEASDGLENKVVRLLENAHIIRGEKRAGATWFELAHDRLIAPVRRSNNAWFQQNLSLFQRQAVVWNQQDRSEGLLLRGTDLDDARKLAQDLVLTADEQSYLEACLNLRKREQRDRRQRQFIAIGLVASLIFLAMAIMGLITANNARSEALISAAEAGTARADALSQKEEAEKQKAEAESQRIEAEKQKAEAEKQGTNSLIRQLGAQAVILAPTDPDLAMLLASLSSDLQAKIGGSIPLEIKKNLLTTLSSGPRPLKYLRGHEGPVLSVAVSPDSRWIASAGEDGTIRIWDIYTGELLFSLAGHTGPVNSIAFEPDRFPPILASAGEDKTVRNWKWTDVKKMPEANIFATFGEPMNALAFSPANRILAIGGDDKKIYIYDLETGENISTFDEHTAPIDNLVFNRDGFMLASIDNFGDLRLWDVSGMSAINSSNPNPAAPTNKHGITFSPDNLFVIYGIGSTTSWFHANSEAGASYDYFLSQQFVEHTSGVRSMAFSADGSRFASASEDWRIGYCYNYSNNIEPGCRSIIYLSAHDGPVNSLAFSPDNRWLVSGGDDGNVLIWNAYNPAVSRSLFAPPVQGRRWNIEGLAFGPDSKTLASSNWDGSIRFWDVERGTILSEFYPYQGTLGAIALSPDGEKLAFGAGEPPHRIWNKDGSVFRDLSINTGLSGVAFSPDGRWLASDNNAARSICLWSLDGQTDVCQSLPGGETAGTFAFSPDSRFLASSLGTKVVLWDMSTFPMTARTLGSHDGGIFTLAFSADGKWLASGGSDYTVRLWALQPSSTSSIVLRNSGRFSRRVAFSPDSQLLISANEDWTIRWWDVQSAEPLAAPVKVRFDRLDGIAISPDGKWLASGSFDGIIDIWPGEISAWKSSACKIANRNLTYAEWIQYVGNALPFQAVCPGLPLEKTPLPTPKQ